MFVVCLSISLMGFSAGQRLKQQQDKLNTNLCIWDSNMQQCKANPEVKQYLSAHSFEEQKMIGASQCVVEDNPTDCNALPGCEYNDDIDGNYNNIYDKPDRQMCVQSMGDASTLSEMLKQYNMKQMQNALKKCFNPASYWYIIFDCESRSVCEGICGEEDPYLGDMCGVDITMMTSSQRAMFLNSSLVLMNALESGDQDALKQLAVRDISQDASYFCTSVFPVIFPCLGGIMGSDDNSPDCYLGNPAKFYWRDQAYLHLFDQSQNCYKNHLENCELLQVVANWELNNKCKHLQQIFWRVMEIFHLKTTLPVSYLYFLQRCLQYYIYFDQKLCCLDVYLVVYF
eukprot:TRINITY_DN5895_c0_g2_i1.p1 TRINITY_DN5895_c0_g2~~TRINITY_DN5895_c0_g2_i1.p1  ORF type:complete len:342 (-),score=24.97 TRINITY_DN5895_c0_g2_i1:144-1169(-)